MSPLQPHFSRMYVSPLLFSSGLSVNKTSLPIPTLENTVKGSGVCFLVIGKAFNPRACEGFIRQLAFYIRIADSAQILNGIRLEQNIINCSPKIVTYEGNYFLRRIIELLGRILHSVIFFCYSYERSRDS